MDWGGTTTSVSSLHWRGALRCLSYKPVLLKALVRIARDAPALRIDLLTIGDYFVRLYWVQTVVFRLRQAATLVREPEVVQAIRRAAQVHRTQRLTDLPAKVRDALAREMSRILKINVLRAFHRSKPEAMPELFTWNAADDAIDISPAALTFLIDNAAVLESLANLWWARYLERVNLLAPRVIDKVERDGAQRGSLSQFLKLLRRIDAQECFYCGADLLEQMPIHVDHVIPWSFLLTDCTPFLSSDRLVRTTKRRSVEWPAGWAPTASRRPIRCDVRDSTRGRGRRRTDGVET